MAQPREEIKQVKRLINSMLDEGQTPEQMQQLMTLLDHDPEACEAYLDFMMMHGSLQRQWGGSIAQVPGLPSLSSPVIRPIRRFSLRRHILAATLLILGSLFGVLWARWYHHKTSTPAYVATLTHAIDAKWIRSMPSTAPGTLLKQGHYYLYNGVAEIKLFDGTAITLEGPTQIDLLTTNRVSLTEGVLAARVPSQATGFSVSTPSAEIVDLGTYIGVKVDDQGTTWTEVFNGNIKVTVNDLTGTTRFLHNDEAVRVDGKTLDIRSVKTSTITFPQPTRTFAPSIQGDFEPNDVILNAGIPTQAGHWSGDTCKIVGPEQGITPYSGQGMLKFLETSAPKDRPRSLMGASQQWRIIPLDKIRHQVRQGYGSLDMSVYFNRVATKSNRRDVMQGLSVHAFRGEPGSAEPFERHIQSLNTRINTDNDPKSWERAELHFNIPSQADYLVIELRTAIDISSGIYISQFEGHYADDLKISIRIGPTPAEPN